MSRNDIKYAVLEENGGELTVVTEHVPTAKDVAFLDEMGLSDNLQEATTFSAKVPFSFNKILNAKTITVPEDQQMIVFEEVAAYGSGDLILAGDVVITN